MRYTLTALVASAACGLLVAATSPAEAKGCLKGAVVGGAAGHMAGHGVLGAAGGCAVGHHMAHKADRDRMREQDSYHRSADPGDRSPSSDYSYRR